MTLFAMLSLDNLSKSYGGRRILDGVSWAMNDDARGLASVLSGREVFSYGAGRRAVRSLA